MMFSRIAQRLRREKRSKMSELVSWVSVHIALTRQEDCKESG
jgi:hypothetical protein